MRRSTVLAGVVAAVGMGAVVYAAPAPETPQEWCRVVDLASGDEVTVPCYRDATTTTTTTVPETSTTTTVVEATTSVPSTTEPPPTTTTTTTVPASPGFVATFDTSADFYDRFDYGFSGADPAANGNADRLVEWQGDHDLDCNGPDTQRTVNIDANVSDPTGRSYADFDPIFWHCRGHLMTATNLVGYNIAWFSPKPTFTGISRVCWDINQNRMSTRKWTQVLFVGADNAAAYPSARGSGGYDLGFTNPDFRDNGQPSTGILPIDNKLSGIFNAGNTYFRLFDDAAGGWQDGGWNASSWQDIVTADKATRTTTCVENFDAAHVLVTHERIDGSVHEYVLNGQIPQDARRVVFQDDNYNPPKGDYYDPNALTWHWDNIIVETN